MSEVLIPPWIIPEEEPQEPLDEGSSVFNAAFAPGLTQRQSYGGMRLKLSRRHTVRLEEKAQLLSALRSTRGRYNVVRSKVHFALRGSFPATELLTNNTFANGTTGWTASAGAALSVSDRVMRLAALQSGANPSFSQAVSGAVQYAPYALRAVIMDGAQSAGLSFSAFMDDGLSGVQAASTARGLITASGVNFSSSTLTHYPALFGVSAGYTAGAYVSISYSSLSRCALVDNGPNALLQSETFGTTWTATRASVNGNVNNAPDGTATADRIIEDGTASNTHFINQDVTVAATALDYSYGCAIKAGTRTWAVLEIRENTGTFAVRAFFNLSTGAVGTTLTQTNWSNLRTSVSDLGDGWYSCRLTARKTNAATSLSARIYLASADNTITYSGDGVSYVAVWRATLAQSSVPTRLVQTTSASTTGASQTGSVLHVKGLPASTTGLLLPEDIFEINGELKTCTAALNSDAAGLGYLQFEPALVRSPADNDPVIILDPMGKFLMSNLKIDNEFGTQAKVSYDLEHIYE